MGGKERSRGGQGRAWKSVGERVDLEVRVSVNMDVMSFSFLCVALFPLPMIHTFS